MIVMNTGVATVDGILVHLGGNENMVISESVGQ